MGEILVLKEKEHDYVKNDYVAQEIQKAFGIKNLHVYIYSNEEWSFYRFVNIATSPFLTMEGCCFVRNATREFTIMVNKKENNTYSAVLEDSKVVVFKTENLPKKTDNKLPRFE